MRRRAAKAFPKEMRKDIGRALKPPTPEQQQAAMEAEVEQRVRGLGLAVIKAKEILRVGRSS
jgi:endonuclease III